MSRASSRVFLLLARTNKVGFEKALVAKLLIDYARTGRTPNETYIRDQQSMAEEPKKQQTRHSRKVLLGTTTSCI